MTFFDTSLHLVVGKPQENFLIDSVSDAITSSMYIIAVDCIIISIIC